MRMSDWSSDVCSSDLDEGLEQRTDRALGLDRAVEAGLAEIAAADHRQHVAVVDVGHHHAGLQRRPLLVVQRFERARHRALRSEEHTSELQSLMRISYAVFCSEKKHDQKPSSSSCRAL